jgi:hypothetical protein
MSERVKWNDSKTRLVCYYITANKGFRLNTENNLPSLRQTWNSLRARKLSSRKICLRLWKKMWKSSSSSCGRQFQNVLLKVRKRCLLSMLICFILIQLCAYYLQKLCNLQWISCICTVYEQNTIMQIRLTETDVPFSFFSNFKLKYIFFLLLLRYWGDPYCVACQYIYHWPQVE